MAKNLPRMCGKRGSPPIAVTLVINFLKQRKCQRDLRNSMCHHLD